MALRDLLLTVISLFFLTALLVEISSHHGSYVEEGQVALLGDGGRRLIPKTGPLADCGGLCGVRCSLHSRPKICQRACGTCCYRCKCVPPGTSGNRELCGACYANMTTHYNKPKCP